MMTTLSSRVVWCFVWLAMLAGMMAVAEGPAEVAVRPHYSDGKKLVLPAGYRTWVFAGANLSPEYKSENGVAPAPPADVRKAQPGDQFHHIYINPESYHAFRKTGRFPDPTMLVLEVFRAETRDPKGILSGGQVEAERVGLSVAVKDSRRPGGGVPWAYYSFDVEGNPKPIKPVVAHADKECYACHLQHASSDNVWVQFYPALRDPD